MFLEEHGVPDLFEPASTFGLLMGLATIWFIWEVEPTAKCQGVELYRTSAFKAEVLFDRMHRQSEALWAQVPLGKGVLDGNGECVLRCREMNRVLLVLKGKVFRQEPGRGEKML